MRDRFISNPLLTPQHSTTWLDHNPLAVPTERELYVLEQNLPVYRVLLQKSSLLDDADSLSSSGQKSANYSDKK